MQPTDVDLAEFACDMVARFSEQIERAGSRVRLTAPLPVGGSWDRLRLEQVLTNLLSNALKYAPDALTEVRVEASNAEAESELGRGASFTVRLPRARASE